MVDFDGGNRSFEALHTVRVEYGSKVYVVLLRVIFRPGRLSILLAYQTRLVRSTAYEGGGDGGQHFLPSQGKNTLVAMIELSFMV